MADLKPLQAELDAVLGRVNAWSLSKEKELNNLKSSHNAFLDTHNDMTMELKQREKTSKLKMEKFSQAAAKSQQTLGELQGQVEDLNRTSNTLPSELMVMKKELEAEKENFFREEDACQKARECKKMNLEAGHEFYEKNLALRFEREMSGALSGSLVIKMHNIDPKDPQRQFFFRIRVDDETNLYNVLECTPRAAELDGLVTQLNVTNDLSLFVRRLRKAWCDAAAAAAGVPAGPSGGDSDPRRSGRRAL